MDGLTAPMRTKSDMDWECDQLYKQIRQILEPPRAREQTNRIKEILDAIYEKADLPRIAHEQYKHLSPKEKKTFVNVAGVWSSLRWDFGWLEYKASKSWAKRGSKTLPCQASVFNPTHLPQSAKKEVERLVKLGVLKQQPDSEWAVPTFIIPKKDKTVRFISTLREIDKQIVHKPYPIPKISSGLQEMEGFTFASQLDLNMGYYAIRLDSDVQKICTIILPWGKYSYLHLPMGLANAPDIFQEKNGRSDRTFWICKSIHLWLAMHCQRFIWGSFVQIEAGVNLDR